MVQLERLKNALSRIRVMFVDASDPTHKARAAACVELAEIHAVAREAYCLSRCLKQHQLSLLISQTYATACSAQEVDEHPPSLIRACIRSIDARLKQAIHELDGIVNPSSVAEWEDLPSQEKRHPHYVEQMCVPFHAETLRILITWELSISSMDNDSNVSVPPMENLSFLYEPISLATFMARLIHIVPAKRQNSFEINVGVRGLSVVFEIPLTKSSIVDVLIDPFSDLYFLARLAESAGISLVIDESGMRLVIPLQLPDRRSLNVDYGALSTIVASFRAEECCASE